MSQDRLDHSCRLPVGTRDAVHVPFVVAAAAVEATTIDDRINGLKPGSYVKFLDDGYTKFVVCEKAEAQGVLNPFVDEISYYEPVVVMMMPGITSPVRHHFDIDPRLKDMERHWLEAELAQAKQEDPDCAGCWVIKNNRVIRM